MGQAGCPGLLGPVIPNLFFLKKSIFLINDFLYVFFEIIFLFIFTLAPLIFFILF